MSEPTEDANRPAQRPSRDYSYPAILYAVADSATVIIRVRILNRNIGATTLHLDGRTWSPDTATLEHSGEKVGTGETLKNKTLTCVTAILNVNTGDNRCPVEYILEGGADGHVVKRYVPESAGQHGQVRVSLPFVLY